MNSKLLGFIAFLFAFYVEFVLMHKPCNLCLLERIPYFLTIIIIVFLLIAKKFEKSLVLIIAIIFLLSFFLSFFIS